MSKPDTKAIRARMETTSPAPWTYTEVCNEHVVIKDANGQNVAFLYKSGDRFQLYNAQWICAIHHDMAALLARVEELEAELQKRLENLEDMMGEDM